MTWLFRSDRLIGSLIGDFQKVDSNLIKKDRAFEKDMLFLKFY